MGLQINRVAAALCIPLVLCPFARALAQPSPVEETLSALGGGFTWQGAESTVTGSIPGSAAGTLTGILLTVGDRVTITATGAVSTLGPNASGPDGNPNPCTSDCQLPSAHFGALIGKIGTDGPWFLIGADRVFTASRAGVLIMGVNDTIHDNNTGAFFVTVTIEGSTAPCVPGPTTLCLIENRFRVETAWGVASGQNAFGGAANCGTPDSGLFWFFSPSNWEMLVKIVNGCSLNNRYWVFMAATTNVAFTLRITDTQTGVVQQYFNSLNHLAPPLADTSAFAACP